MHTPGISQFFALVARPQALLSVLLCDEVCTESFFDDPKRMDRICEANMKLKSRLKLLQLDLLSEQEIDIPSRVYHSSTTLPQWSVTFGLHYGLLKAKLPKINELLLCTAAPRRLPCLFFRSVLGTEKSIRIASFQLAAFRLPQLIIRDNAAAATAIAQCSVREQ